MKLGIRLHLAGLSLSNTITELEKFGVEQIRKAVHDWVQKADLQPTSGELPNQVALDETAIRVNDEQFWRYAAIDPAINSVLHIRLYPHRTTALTEMFLGELMLNHAVDDSRFLVDGAPWLQTAPSRRGLRLRPETHGNRNAVECIYHEVKRRTHSFSNTFKGTDPETGENWLLTHAR